MSFRQEHYKLCHCAQSWDVVNVCEVIMRNFSNVHEIFGKKEK